MSDLLASASGYGGGYGAGGYGSYIDCNSALALLSFILFIDLLRDIVQQITSATTATAPATRKRRSLAALPANESTFYFDSFMTPSSDNNSDSEPYSVLEFIQMGGADGLYEELPHILLPLLSSLSESTDVQRPAPCIAAPLCRANEELVRRFGEMGRILGSLLSNVLAKAFTGGRVPLMQEVQEAARQGRLLHSCGQYVQQCAEAQLRPEDHFSSPFAWIPSQNSTLLHREKNFTELNLNEIH